MVQNQVLAAKAEGTAIAQAGASMSGGGSVERVIHDINTTEGNNITKIVSNQDRELTELYYELESRGAENTNRKDFLTIQGPSGFEAGARIGQAAFSGYQGGMSFGKAWDDYRGGSGPQAPRQRVQYQNY